MCSSCITIYGQAVNVLIPLDKPGIIVQTDIELQNTILTLRIYRTSFYQIFLKYFRNIV